MLVPAGTPRVIVGRMQDATAGVLKSAQVWERLTRQGLQLHGSTPPEFDRYLKSEVERWAKVVKAANIRVD